jgi:hypothetical protein
MKCVVLTMVLAFSLGIALAGCSADDNRPGEQAKIPANAQTIVFSGGGGWGPVTFMHQQHADEYYNGVCLTCHDHEDVGGETHWSCRECHTAGADSEALCDEYDVDHGCIMTQCHNCHVLEGPPAPDGSACGSCHA